MKQRGGRIIRSPRVVFKQAKDFTAEVAEFAEEIA